MAKSRHGHIVADKITLTNDLSVGGVLTNNGGTIVPTTIGNVYYCNPANGDDGYTGKTPDQAFASLDVAYDATTNNNNDVVFLIGDSSGMTLDATLTWSNNYTHLVGVCAPVGIGNRARVFLDADADDVTPMIDITGTGCVFKNLYFFDGVDDAGCLVNVRVTGDRNYFENVHFAGIGHATVAGEANARSLVIEGAEECRFVHCIFGVDTIAREADNADVELKYSASAGSPTRLLFEDCVWLAYTVTAGDGSVFVYTDAQFDLDRIAIFNNCLFINQPANVITSSVAKTQAIKAAADLNGVMLFKDCAVVGCTALADNYDRVYAAGAANHDSDWSAGVARAGTPT